jgi:hypothetical protein
MSAPRKAVFAATQSHARRVAAAFGLSPEEWSSFGFAAALTGRRFDRMVFVLPVNPTGRDLTAIMNLKTLLDEKGVHDVISPQLSSTPITPQRED